MMRKTSYNQLFDIERKMREIRTLHAMEKLPTKHAKLILQDLQISFNELLEKLPEENREFFLKNKGIR